MRTTILTKDSVLTSRIASAIFLLASLSLCSTHCYGQDEGNSLNRKDFSVRENDAELLSNQEPNVVFLLTDDQATISMGCYGNSQVKTPNLDALAADGVIFDRHYVTTAICMASRCNIMTGLYEFRNGCNFGYGKLPLKLWKNSYPMLMRSAGYRTAIAGKIGFEV